MSFQALSLDEASKRVGKGKRWLLNEIRSGRLAAKAVGAVIRIDDAELARWFKTLPSAETPIAVRDPRRNAGRKDTE